MTTNTAPLPIIDDFDAIQAKAKRAFLDSLWHMAAVARERIDCGDEVRGGVEATKDTQRPIRMIGNTSLAGGCDPK